MKTLIIIDDEIEMEDLYRLTLENEISNEMIDLIFFHDSRDFLNWFSDNKKIDLLICDINMPYISGIDLLKQISPVTSTFPIFILSGFEAHQFEDDLQELNITKFFTKPIHFDQFAHEILKEIGIKSTHVESRP